VTLVGASRAQIARVVDALWPIGGRRKGQLPAPAFPAADVWAKLETVVPIYRELDSVSATAERLGIEQRTVRNRLAWTRLLSSYPHPRRHRCTRAERGRRLGPGPPF